jgi:hypothetical protein
VTSFERVLLLKLRVSDLKLRHFGNRHRTYVLQVKHVLSPYEQLRRVRGKLLLRCALQVLPSSRLRLSMHKHAHTQEKRPKFK